MIVVAFVKKNVNKQLAAFISSGKGEITHNTFLHQATGKVSERMKNVVE